MALKIRLQRGGNNHRPRYRIVVAEALSRRDGRFVEIVGRYNPQAREGEEELNLKLDRIDYWMGVGAKPTDTARTLVNRYRRQTAAAEPVQA